MEQNSVIIFKLSKKKKRGLYLVALFSGLISFGLAWLSQSLKLGSGKGFVLVVDAIFIVITLFCIAGIVFLSKEKNGAMYISDEGIMDISTGNRIGTVLWKDVEQIKVMDDISNLRQRYLVLKVANPVEYISREDNRAKRRSLELRLQYYGSPICFSNRALDCEFDELKDAVFLKYEQYKTNNT